MYKRNFPFLVVSPRTHALREDDDLLPDVSALLGRRKNQEAKIQSVTYEKEEQLPKRDAYVCLSDSEGDSQSDHVFPRRRVCSILDQVHEDMQIERCGGDNAIFDNEKGDDNGALSGRGSKRKNSQKSDENSSKLGKDEERMSKKRQKEEERRLRDEQRQLERERKQEERERRKAEKQEHIAERRSERERNKRRIKDEVSFDFGRSKHFYEL